MGGAGSSGNARERAACRSEIKRSGGVATRWRGVGPVLSVKATGCVLPKTDAIPKTPMRKRARKLTEPVA